LSFTCQCGAHASTAAGTQLPSDAGHQQQLPISLLHACRGTSAEAQLLLKRTQPATRCPATKQRICVSVHAGESSLCLPATHLQTPHAPAQCPHCRMSLARPSSTLQQDSANRSHMLSEDSVVLALLLISCRVCSADSVLLWADQSTLQTHTLQLNSSTCSHARCEPVLRPYHT
jgi:hypothetical protein